MAAAPVKSQPLHNFSLSFLRWGNKNQMNNHRLRKRDSPPSDRDSDTDHDSAARVHDGGGSRAVKSRPGVSAVEKSNKHGAKVKEKQKEGAEGAEEETAKGEGDENPWKLRLRRGLAKGSGVEICGGGGESPVGAVKSTRLRGTAEALGCERKEKVKLWISLSREEIEEDIFLMTGSKPARRPRRRPKNVQKNVDNVLPGFWLAGMTADCYRLPDAPAKI